MDYKFKAGRTIFSPITDEPSSPKIILEEGASFGQVSGEDSELLNADGDPANGAITEEGPAIIGVTQGNLFGLAKFKRSVVIYDIIGSNISNLSVEKVKVNGDKEEITEFPILLGPGEDIALSGTANEADNFVSFVMQEKDLANTLEPSEGGGGGDVDLSNYYTKAQTDLAIETSANTKVSNAIGKTIFVKEGDVLQDIINSLDEGSVIIPAKATSWGDVTLKPRVNLVGLDAPNGLRVEIGRISFAPTTGANASANEIHCHNLFINGGNSKEALLIGGTNPYRLRFTGSYFSKSSGAQVTIDIANNAAGSSVWFLGCYINSSAATTYSIRTNCPWVRFQDTPISGGTKAFSVLSGLVQVEDCPVEYAQASSDIAEVAAGATLLLARALIRNIASNASGISVAAGGILILGSAAFDVSDGTGFAVDGAATGVVVYDRITINNFPGNARNVKIRDTLTLLQMTTSFTPSA